MKRLYFGAAVVALLAIGSVAYSEGLWFGLPVVGGPTYCNTNIAGVPGTTPVCTVSTPAGTTVYPDLTGGENVPADVAVLPPSTLNNNGWVSPTAGTPQTVLIPVPSLASGAYLLTSNLGLATVSTSTPQGVTNLILNATGTITTWNAAPPPFPYDGQLWRVTTNQSATTFTLQTAVGGASISTPTKPTALVISAGSYLGGFTFLYNASNNIWYRMQ